MCLKGRRQIDRNNILCCRMQHNLEEKETHTYLGEVLASRVENLKIKESRTLRAQMPNVSTGKLSSPGYERNTFIINETWAHRRRERRGIRETAWRSEGWRDGGGDQPQWESLGGWVNFSYLGMWCCKAIHNYELWQQSHLLPYNTCLCVTDCIYVISWYDLTA